MPYSTSRRTRERKLRAKYRKKIWTAAIVMLIIGLVLGFVVCAYSAKNSDRVAQLLKLAPQDESRMTIPTPTPEATDEVVATPTLAITQVSQAPVEAMDSNDVFGTESALGGDDALAPLSGDEDFADPVMSDEDLAALGNDDGAEGFEGEDWGEGGEFPDEGEPAIAAAPIVTPEATEAPTTEPIVEPTAEPTPEPTAEPTPEATVVPQVVPFGEARDIQTQIKADGSGRHAVDGEDYETLNLTVKVSDYKDFAYFEENYGDKYDLKGGTAAVQLEMTLNNYEGSTPIIPQNFLLITLQGETPEEKQDGYQMIDKEIAGSTNVALENNVTTTLYKRYAASEMGDATYLVLTAYNDGVESVYWFEITPPEPVGTPVPESSVSAEASVTTSSSAEGLTVGSKGDEVKKLQRVLINKNLLSGEPDGHFGKYTAEAVKEMQRKYGMEVTGVADQAFLDKLYADQ